MKTVDIIVVGGGPAGAMFAQLCPDGAEIVLIDQKSANESSFRKPCGGLLSPDAQRILSAYQMTLPKSVCTDPQIFAVKTMDIPAQLSCDYQRFYINMDRHQFDLWMMSRIPAHVRRIVGRCTAFQNVDGFYQVTYVDETQTEQVIQARNLVGADGAHSQVRAAFFPHHPITRLLAIQEILDDHSMHPFYSAIFDEETSPYCSWTIAKDNQQYFGGIFPLHQARQHFQLQKERLAAAGLNFGPVLKTEACLVNYPRSPGDIELGADGVFLIGEAAGWISPSSFEGISWALSSAIACAKSLVHEHLNMDLYRFHSRHLYPKLVMKIMKAHVLYQPHLRKIILKSRFRAIAVNVKSVPNYKEMKNNDWFD